MRVNIGGQQTIGRFPLGWICVDILPGADVHCNIAYQELPFSVHTVDAIYCSHVLEHIWAWQQDFVMREFYRVTCPGALIRIVVPDMDIAINDYVSLREDEQPGRLAGCMGWWFNPTINGQTGEIEMNHVYGFNWYSLSAQVRKAGFINIRRSQYNKGSKVFENCDNPGHENTSLYLEAERP